MRISYPLFLAIALCLSPLASAEALLVAEGNYPELVVTQSGETFCTGTIVGPKAVLLAAHCVDEKNPLVRFSYGFDDTVYTAIGVPSEAYETKGHDLAVAVVIGGIQTARPISVLTSEIQEQTALRLFSFGCNEQGETVTELDTLRMGDTIVMSVQPLHLSLQTPSYSSACFATLGAPAVLLSGKERHVVAMAPSGYRIGEELRMIRMDTADSTALFRRVTRSHGAKICGYQMICHGPEEE